MRIPGIVAAVLLLAGASFVVSAQQITLPSMPVSETTTLTRAATTNPVPVATPPPDEGIIVADIPLEADLNEPFLVDVWYEPKDRNAERSVTVMMERSNKVVYEPRRLELKPFDSKEVKVTLLKSRSGLGKLVFGGRCCPILTAYVNTGFAGHLKWSGPEGMRMESRMAQPISAQFVDADQKPLKLDAPVTVRINATNAEIRQGRGNWTDMLEVRLREGATELPAMEIRGMRLSNSTARLQVVAMINNDIVILSDSMVVDVTPPWWLGLGLGILGGALFSLYRGLKDVSSYTALEATKAAVRGFLAGVFAGGFAFLIAQYDVLGIDIDTTNPQAFVLLGFLMSYVGIEPMLDAVLKKRREVVAAQQSSEPAQLPLQVREQTSPSTPTTTAVVSAT